MFFNYLKALFNGVGLVFKIEELVLGYIGRKLNFALSLEREILFENADIHQIGRRKLLEPDLFNDFFAEDLEVVLVGYGYSLAPEQIE